MSIDLSTFQDGHYIVNVSLNLDFHYNMKILLIIDARENRRGIQDI